MRHIIWFSCGIASMITAKIILEKVLNAELVYCDTGGEHEDNKRVIKDFETYSGKQIIILKSKYENHFDVFEKTRYLNGVAGARCTVELKKRLRFEYQQIDDVQYFGFTKDEKIRATRFLNSFPEINVKSPLIDLGLSKKDCIKELLRLKIELPKMYSLGFNNNNCIGCVKGGKGYWNKIKLEFPEIFNKMSKLERKLNHSCINGKYLDELEPNEVYRSALLNGAISSRFARANSILPRCRASSAAAYSVYSAESSYSPS